MPLQGWGRGWSVSPGGVSERTPPSACKLFALGSKCIWHSLWFQTYRHIFTSPSSAYDENTTSEITSRRRDVASTLRMGGHVTGQSIAYAATQVCQPFFFWCSFPDAFCQSLFSHCAVLVTGRRRMLVSISQLSMILLLTPSRILRMTWQRHPLMSSWSGGTGMFTSNISSQKYSYESHRCFLARSFRQLIVGLALRIHAAWCRNVGSGFRRVVQGVLANLKTPMHHN